MDNKKIICPVCGLVNGVRELPWRDDLTASQDICPCCGTHYGEDDWGETKEQIKEAHIKLRQKWIEGEMKWKHQDTDSLKRKPANWNPKKQLENIPKEFR